MSGRPTWAQVSAVEALLELLVLIDIALSENAVIAPDDRSELRGIVTAAETLVVLIDGDESWIDMAIAFDAESSAFLRAALERRVGL